MAANVVFRPNPSAIKALEGDPPTRAEVLRAGRQLAKVASAGAPRLTGRLAGSIQASPSGADPNVADVSWAARYHYGIFQEVGFRGRPGRHFLRRAFETYAHF